MNMPTGYWNSEKMSMMWGYMRWFISENQVWVMIVVAVCIAISVTSLILHLFTKKNEDDDDYEIKEI